MVFYLAFPKIDGFPGTHGTRSKGAPVLNAYFFFQGATIKAEEETGRILIARVMHGGAADRSGLISVGDEVIEVNGVNVEGQTPNDVLKILVSFLDISHVAGGLP